VGGRVIYTGSSSSTKRIGRCPRLDSRGSQRALCLRAGGRQAV
jgi:hypothetical protein